MSLIDKYYNELEQYRHEPVHWVRIQGQGVHWDDFMKMTTGHVRHKEAFFRTLSIGQEFPSKQQLIKSYTDWCNKNL